MRYQALILCTLALALILLSGSTGLAQHEGHDMSKMPGTSKQKPKTTPKKKQATEQKKDEMQGMDMKEMPAPSTSPTPSTETKPTPEQQMNMPMPAQSPTPQAKPGASSAKPENPQAIPTTDALQNAPAQVHPGANNMKMGGAKSDAMQDSMPGMSMGSMKMGPMVETADKQMAIRVGASESNIMLMGQMGSGTSWQPASTPMQMWHRVAGEWLLMFHGEARLGVIAQSGPRGVSKVESSNWFMPMAIRRAGPGTLQLRSMFSLEPFTFARGGSPLLFQTGETYKGQPLIDRQHPHDLFMELSANYTIPLGERGTWFTYFGFPGEPALGPVAFMHRASASENPSAPLAHHQQDSTHISFGVFTTGFTYRWFKLEGSIFNGHEPDENRYNFEFKPWNSRSARLSFAPNSNWSMQLSYGLLRDPEALERGTTRRTTASVSYNKPLARGNWATTLIWGRNHETHEDGEVFNLNGYTAESTVNFLEKNYLYTRLELVDKNELLRADDRARLGIAETHPSFRIGAYTFGGARDVWKTDKFSLALGTDVTFYSKPAMLEAVYGDNPISYRFFIRVRPSAMNMNGHSSH